jgi:hypothetical protein
MTGSGLGTTQTGKINGKIKERLSEALGGQHLPAQIISGSSVTVGLEEPFDHLLPDRWLATCRIGKVQYC